MKGSFRLSGLVGLACMGVAACSEAVFPAPKVTAQPPARFSIHAPPTPDAGILYRLSTGGAVYLEKLKDQLASIDPSGRVAVSVINAAAPGSELIYFDGNADGIVTSDEIMRVGAQLMRSRAEMSSHDRRKRPACNLPKPSEHASILVLTAETGNALTNVSVSDQSEITAVVSLKVEEGDQPIYIFAVSAEPVIWSLSGATHRVETFAAQRSSQNYSGAGVVGLDEERVSFEPIDSCAINEDSGDMPDFYLGPVVKKALQRDDLTAIHTTGYGGINIPSATLSRGAATTKASGPRIQTEGQDYVVDGNNVKRLNPGSKKHAEQMLKRFWPGGVVQFDLDAVVSAGRKEYYKVMPSHAGILQLMDEGYLSYDPRGAYVINATFPQFPSGLYGALSEDFLLPDGVAMPAGELGHASVYKFETGECLEGSCKFFRDM